MDEILASSRTLLSTAATTAAEETAAAATEELGEQVALVHAAHSTGTTFETGFTVRVVAAEQGYEWTSLKPLLVRTYTFRFSSSAKTSYAFCNAWYFSLSPPLSGCSFSALQRVVRGCRMRRDTRGTHFIRNAFLISDAEALGLTPSKSLEEA